MKRILSKEDRKCSVDVKQASKKRKISRERLPSLRTRMSPAAIYQFINNEECKPSDNQLTAIKEMGFGGLLQLKTDMVPGTLAYWLVSTFDPYKGCLLNGALPILEEDIHACMGIPMGPRVVHEAAPGDKCPQFLAVLENFKRQYQKDPIDVKDILNKLSSQTDGGDDFKRNFIVYIFSSFLGGVKGNRASLRILKCLSDTGVISQFNWSNFIKRKLAEQVLSWQQEEFREIKKVKENWFGGPIMVLVFIYLDRCVFKARTVSRQFPTLSTWTKEAISKRIKDELKAKEDFGQGSVEAAIVINQPSHVLAKIEHVQSSKSTVEQKQQSEQEQFVTETEAAVLENKATPLVMEGNDVLINKLVHTAKTLAQAFVDYKSVACEAINKLPSSSVVCKMVAAVDGIADGFNLSQEQQTANEEEENIKEDNEEEDNEENDNVEVKDNCTEEEQTAKEEEENIKEDNEENDNVEVKDNVEEENDNVEEKDDVEEKKANIEEEKDDVKEKDDVEVKDDVKEKDTVKDNLVDNGQTLHGWSEDELMAALNYMGEALKPIDSQGPHLRKTRINHNRHKKPHSPPNPNPNPEYPSFNLLPDFLNSPSEPNTSSLDPDSQPNQPPPNVNNPENPPHISPCHDVHNLPVCSPIVANTISENQNPPPATPVVASTTSDHDHHHPTVIVLPDTPDAPIVATVNKTAFTRHYIRRRSPRLSPVDEVPCKTPTTAPIPFPLSPLAVEDEDDVPDLIPEDVRGKRVVVAAEVYRSPYLQRNINILKDLNKEEKNILDFILGDLHDGSEIVFKTQSQTLTRSELKSLVEGDRVSSHVIDAWCEILNNNEVLRARDSPCRLFVSYSKHKYLANVDVAGASLIFVPISFPSCPPFLFCFNLGNNKMQIIHPMNSTSVKYGEYIQPTKDLIIRLLEQRLPVVKSISWTMPEVFIPKSVLNCDQIDNGVHLLRLLETYKGTKTSYSMFINNETLLKRYSLRVCYRIITCDVNLLRARVVKDARDWSFVPRGSRLLHYSDDELVNFVWGRRAKNGLHDAMVSTEFMEVTRSGLQTLRPHGFVMDQVIDMFRIKSTLGRTDVLYLPTTVYTVSLETKPYIWSNYIKSSYIPVDGSHIEKVFIPMYKDKHWWACVCNLKRKKNYILDSSKGLVADKKDVTIDILYNVAGVLKNIPSYESMRLIHMADISDVLVPQQKTVFDCGAFVLKFLSALDDESLWTKAEYFQKLPQFRKLIMLDLLKWEKNTIKEFV